MNDAQLEIMKVEIKKAVKEQVNGSIADLDKKLTNHMAEVAPFLQAKAGGTLLFKILLSAGAAAVAWNEVKVFFLK